MRDNEGVGGLASTAPVTGNVYMDKILIVNNIYNHMLVDNRSRTEAMGVRTR